MKFEINLIQEAICDNERFNQITSQALLLIQQVENNDMIMTVEMADNDIVNTPNNNNNNNDNSENKEDGNGTEDVEVDMDSKENKNENKKEYDNYSVSSSSPFRIPNFDPFKYKESNINNEYEMYDPNQSIYEHEKMREMSFKMMDSWNDKTYSHLRTFRNYSPMFSNKNRLYDHSTRQMVFDDDEAFCIKDICTSLGKRTYNKPSDYIRFRFNGDNTLESNGTFDFFYKLTVMRSQIKTKKGEKDELWGKIYPKEIPRKIPRNEKKYLVNEKNT